MSSNLDAAIARGKNRREHFAKKQQLKTQIESLATKTKDQSFIYINNHYTLFSDAEKHHAQTLYMIETTTTPTP
ncbi:MAG: hypothetical protein PVI75_00980 [Gammaproteobacteria bacterium]|jgi:gluconate kinase